MRLETIGGGLNEPPTPKYVGRAMFVPLRTHYCTLAASNFYYLFLAELLLRYVAKIIISQKQPINKKNQSINNNPNKWRTYVRTGRIACTH
jgi:hypothetical protein